MFLEYPRDAGTARSVDSNAASLTVMSRHLQREDGVVCKESAESDQKGRGNTMNVQTAINDWMEKNGPMMVECPYQPGRLLITKTGCSERRKKAQVQNFASLMEGNFIDYMYKMGLYICLHCNGEEGRPG